ncbi:MAG: nucleoside phosphorylase [Candidatus Firestonebacteria bacterium]
MKRKLFPILEYDKTRKAIINPSAFFDGKTIPENVVLCFFKDVIRELRVKHRIKEIACCRSEMGKHPIYELKIGKKCISVFHSAVGAPLAAGLFEELIALGGKKFIACGGAGVLDRNISAGHIMVPVSAIRDEGVSYHYLPPSREVRPSVKALKAIVNVLKNEKLSYLKCKTWTTDAPYRETPEKITLRKKEGCLSVEMEAASQCFS